MSLNCISVITVCFNSQKTLQRTFDSILKQTFLPFEFIVVDGGSNDHTIEIIQEYESLFVEKGILFKWISEKDEGLYDAMNKGVKMASGDWIHFLNSDDYYVNEYVLQNVSNYLRLTTASVLYGRTINVKEFAQTVSPVIPENKLKLNILIGCPIQQPATFYNKTIFNDLNYSFDISYRISADYKMFVQMIKGKVKFQFIPSFITCFDEGGISTLNKNSLVFIEDIRLLKECSVNTILMHLKRNKYLYKFLIVFFQILSKF